MTNDRSRAYMRVMKTVEDMGPAKLHELEQRRLRTAADTLIFAGTGEYAVFGALDDVEHLMRRLVDSGRWTAERANALVEDLVACGPEAPDVFPSELAA
jgi:hypothetical protein